MEGNELTICEHDELAVLGSVREERSRKTTIAYVAAAIVVALFSALVLGQLTSSPETWSWMIDTLDEKKANVMGLMATTTGASVAVSFAPGDAGSALSEKLVDLSSYFMIILAVIYLEKFLITTIGFVSFTFIVPAACVLFAVRALLPVASPLGDSLRRFGTKLAAFGVMIAMVVPVSVWLSDNIDKTFEESLAISAAESEQLAQDLEASAEGQAASEGFVDGAVNFFKDGFDTLSHSAQEALGMLGTTLNNMVDTLAVMIVTSCLIPILVLLFFFWLMNTVVGLNVGSPNRVFAAARSKARGAASAVSKAANKQE